MHCDAFDCNSLANPKSSDLRSANFPRAAAARGPRARNLRARSQLRATRIYLTSFSRSPLIARPQMSYPLALRCR